MVNVLKLLNLGASILDINVTDTHFLILDNHYTLHFLDKNTFNLVKSTTLTKAHETPHKYAHCFSASINKYICVSFLGTKKAVIIELEDSLKKKAVLSWHESDIESAGFDSQVKYLATGGQDGRVYLYETKHFKMISSLPTRADYISNVDFSPKSDLIACSGFDKFTVVFDLVRNKTRHVLQTPDVAEHAKFFNKNQNIYLILRNGGSVVYDVMQKKTLSTENHFHTWPSAVDISLDQKFAVVGTRGDTIYVIRLEDNARMLDVKLEYGGTSFVKFHESRLLLGFVDGTLAVVDYQHGVEEMEVNLKVKNYRKARDIINENVFLTIHPMMKVFDDDWADVLKAAINLLNVNKIDEAADMADPFLVDPKKQKEFNFYLMQKNVVAQFAEAVEKKDYGKAFEMAALNRFLTKTSAYIELEGHWTKVFNAAKRLLEENPVINQRKVEQLLKPFEMTTKRDIIQQLLKNSQVFTQADSAIKKKDFKKYFSFVAKHPFLKDTDLYDKVIALGEKMMDNFSKLEEQQNFEEAANIANVLKEFPPFKKPVTDRLALMHSKSVFIEAIEKKDIKKAYQILEKYEILKNLPHYDQLLEDFDKKFERAKVYAFEGAPQRVILSMSVYMEIEYWKDKVASILKIAYLNEIENSVTAPDVNWYLTLKRYITRYSKDAEIIKVLNDHKMGDKINSIDFDGDPEGYKKHVFLEEMVVYTTDSNASE